MTLDLFAGYVVFLLRPAARIHGHFKGCFEVHRSGDGGEELRLGFPDHHLSKL